MDAQAVQDILSMDHSELIAGGDPAEAPDLATESLEVKKTSCLSV